MAYAGAAGSANQPGVNPSRLRQSAYMRFAKLDAGAPFNLAASGVPGIALRELEPDLAALEIHGPNSYGEMDLREALGARFGLGAECVVTAEGASMANHLALAALIEPGDEVLLESPTYELIASTLLYLGADLRRFERSAETDWKLDAQSVQSLITPRTRLIVTTNLHNPTSARDDDQEIVRLAAAAEEVGARLLIDEVYRELTIVDDQATTLFRLGGNIVVTSSLTKAYGLSGLRCGWILAQPELTERMWRLNDLYYSITPYLTDQLSLLALGRLSRLRARAHDLLEPNRLAYREILGGHPALDQVIPAAGTTVFPRVLAGRVDDFFQFARSRFETSFVPGRFFERSDHIRVGLAGDPAIMREGYQRLAEALSLWPL